MSRTRLDAVLLDQVCTGDPAAWRRFVPAAAPVIAAVVWRVLARAGRAEDRDDVVQDVFVRLLRDRCSVLRRFDPTRATLTTWLGVIATSAAVDHLRRTPPNGVPLETVADELHSETTSPGHLRLPPDLLTPRMALVLTLLFEDGMDTEEVAQRLGIEAQTVRSLKHKALTRLRAALGEAGMPAPPPA